MAWNDDLSTCDLLLFFVVCLYFIYISYVIYTFHISVVLDLSALKRLKNIVPQSQLCSVYYALVESHLRCGDVVWGSLCKTKLAALQHLQSRAWSIIENA